MNKRGQAILIIVLVMLVVFAIVMSITVWQLGKKTPEEPATNETSTNATAAGTNETEINETATGANKTGANETSTNATTTNETTPYTESVPNPAGTIEWIQQRNDLSGGYFCNKTENPKHQVRLYTYKDINGIRNLSEEYIESIRIDDVCDIFANIDENSTGARYDLLWKWDGVGGIDGYKIYQYYSYGNIKRVYDHYVRLKPEATELSDVSPDMWIFE